MRLLAVALAVLGLLAATGDAGGQSTPRLYVSLPLTGPLKPETQSMVKAIELAVADSGVGMDLVVLDDATKAAGGWTPARTAANARRAAEDPAAVAYIGEFNSGASAVSIPILNEAGILQVSPANAYVGLSRSEAAEPGEPDKYYPSGVRTFGRVAAADHLQAAALAKALAQDGAKRLFLLDDAEVYGNGIAEMVRRRTSVRVVGEDAVDTRARGYRGLARKVRRAKADAVLFGGIARPAVVRLWRALHRAVPKARLYGPDGLNGTPFPRATRGRTRITLPTLPERRWVPAAQSFSERFSARFGVSPRPYALPAYEAARVILDAYAAGARDRAGLAAAFFATRDRDSVLGRYSIDANGDPTAARFGLYDGRLQFKRVVSVP